MTAVKTNYDGICGEECEAVVRIVSLNKLYSEFAPATRLKSQFCSRPTLIFYKPYVTSRKGPLVHNTKGYVDHFLKI